MVASFIPSILEELDDVNIASAQAGHVLRHDGATWVNQQLVHSDLSGLSNDDHTQYALLGGRSGGQTLYGGVAASENLTLRSTYHATKGKIFFGANSVYDEANDKWGFGTSTPTSLLHVNAPNGWWSIDGSKTTLELSYLDFPYARFYIGDNWQLCVENPSGVGSIAFKTGAGRIGINTISPTVSGTGNLHMAADTFRLDTARTPASAGAAGNAGEWCWDSNYIYVCIATNTWRRIAHNTW